jgi:hypothetical protein
MNRASNFNVFVADLNGRLSLRREVRCLFVLTPGELTLAADSTKGKEYTMADNYDLGHLYELMERVSYEARQRGVRVSLSLHCENPELIRVYERVRSKGCRGWKRTVRGGHH